MAFLLPIPADHRAGDHLVVDLGCFQGWLEERSRSTLASGGIFKTVEMILGKEFPWFLLRAMKELNFSVFRIIVIPCLPP
jgi:hypothetical protein